MEKGFNDDELADIMNEIESLEKEFSDEVQGVDEAVLNEAENTAAQEKHIEESSGPEMSDNSSDASSEEVEEVKAAAASHVEHEESVIAEHEAEEVVASQEKEVISELAKMPVEEVVAKHEPQDDNVHPISHNHEHHSNQGQQHFSHSKMDFSIEGEMSLNFNFHVSGQTVKLHIEEGNFAIELDGGMKFILPLEQNKVKKAA